MPAGKWATAWPENLMGSRFEVRHVEVSDAGKSRLEEELGLSCVDINTALAGVDVVILAVPDTVIGTVAASIVDRLVAGTMVIALDAAAPFADTYPFDPT